MKRGYYLVLATALVSGVSIFMNKWAVDGLNPFTFTFAKNALVAVFLVSMIVLMKEWSAVKALSKKQWLQLTTIGLIGGCIPFLLFFKGLQLTSAASAAFMHKTMFIFVALFAALFLKEKIHKSFFIGALLLLAGNFLLLKFTGFDAGVWLILAATLFWAVENTFSKFVLKELNSRIVACGRMFFGSVFIFLFLLLSGNTKQLMFSLPQIEWVLFTGILLLVYVTTWYEGLRTVPVSQATCILLLGSVVTTLLQFAFLDTAVSLVQGTSMVLIIAGVYVVLIPWRSRSPALQ